MRASLAPTHTSSCSAVKLLATSLPRNPQKYTMISPLHMWIEFPTCSFNILKHVCHPWSNSSSFKIIEKRVISCDFITMVYDHPMNHVSHFFLQPSLFKTCLQLWLPSALHSSTLNQALSSHLRKKRNYRSRGVANTRTGKQAGTNKVYIIYFLIK